MNLDRKIKIRNLDVIIPSGEKSHLRWKEYQILSLLIARSPELVTRTEIIENTWKGTYCSDSTINQTIKSIRQKIGDSEHTLIRTIPRLGYKIENQEVFHFTTEEKVNDEDKIIELNQDVISEEQEEISEKPHQDDKGMREEIIKHAEERETVYKERAVHETIKQSTVRHCAFGRKHFFRLTGGRLVKCLTMLALLLVISHFSYVLGNQTRPPVITDIQNNTRVVMTLTLNDPLNNSSQTLLCLYQTKDSAMMTGSIMECVRTPVGPITVFYYL
ncbi:helix-turn-helix domain-containing protein [Affinibrenneria salicis]|uniref:Helix-turn-helix domain-containing protein n=1 Tax=Affinibrenneria salicis TaxID=2590031 RepID=A0A5J5FTX7_9GAMM|nr:helix-turn-helix domain-containing protein [Affinibrenneria salicis]KAA8996981.1 helix-turn-helix domain-containing protein [Affinibrenneria salicis]